jgi:transcriptional regulatory protein LevR
VAIISAFDIRIEGIDYISMDKFFKEFLGEEFEDNIKDEALIKNIKSVYRDYLELKHYDFIVNSLVEIISTTKYVFDIHIDSPKLQGLLMHIGCLIQKLLNREERNKCKNLNVVLSRHQDIVIYLKQAVKVLEEKLQIEFSDDDLANIVEIITNL